MNTRPAKMKEWLIQRKLSSTILYTLISLMGLELCSIFIISNLIPGNYFLKYYLSEKAEENTIKFLDDKHNLLMYDSNAGWINRPNCNINNWQIDSIGSRSSGQKFSSSKNKRMIMFLGNSLTNGVVHVKNTETISAFMEDSLTETLNFATMLYSIDQMYLSYINRHRKYDSNIIVVGLSNSAASGIVNKYIPFKSKTEINIPFIKPRYYYKNKKLLLSKVPSIDEFREIFEKPDLLNEFSLLDDYYIEFENFKRFGSTPFSSLFLFVYKKINSFFQQLDENVENIALLKDIMRLIVTEGDSNGIKVVFMLLPHKSNINVPLSKKFLPNPYLKLFGSLTTEFKILDVRQLFLNSGELVGDLFGKDNTHFTVKGNRVIAEGLKAFIDK